MDVRQLIEGVCKDVGVLLYDFQSVYLKGGTKKLMVYLDKDDPKVSGITVDDCATISRQISSKLGALKAPRDNYSLEVSSPGIDRILRESWHFKRVIGRSVTVETSVNIALDGRNCRKFKGRLLQADDNEIVVSNGSVKLTIPIVDIKKARLNGQEELNKKGLSYVS